ncbi:MAG: hypothetical protein CBC13_00200 [Planctomycetia bacterium TMED53]|nr:MAG: hypothetical protein CBC13_00200 [Planctomycetia bacterium TMED53]
MKWIQRALIPLLILAMLTAIPGIPLGVDLRGYPLLLHLGVGTLLAAILAIVMVTTPPTGSRLQAFAWLLICIGLLALMVPLMGWADSEASHRWLESHGWISIAGLGLLGLSAKQSKASSSSEN